MSTPGPFSKMVPGVLGLIGDALHETMTRGKELLGHTGPGCFGWRSEIADWRDGYPVGNRTHWRCECGALLFTTGDPPPGAESGPDA